jgi:hypothetical protein
MRVLRPDLVAGALDIAQDADRAVEQFLPGLGRPRRWSARWIWSSWTCRPTTLKSTSA